MSPKFGAFFIYLHFQKIKFCVQLYGKWASWGSYNLYFEVLKGQFSKMHWFLISFLKKMSRYYPWTLFSWSPLEPRPLSIKSLLSPCDYMSVVNISWDFDASHEQGPFWTSNKIYTSLDWGYSYSRAWWKIEPIFYCWSPPPNMNLQFCAQHSCMHHFGKIEGVFFFFFKSEMADCTF